MLAAIMLLVAGTLSILRGIAGVTKDAIFLIPSEYSYQLDLIVIWAVSTWNPQPSLSVIDVRETAYPTLESAVRPGSR